MCGAEGRLLADEEATVELGARLALALPPRAVVYLHGDLGAGKTTLARGILHALGHAGAVKSPTYTIVEPYRLPGRVVYHFDLYRLVDPAELEFLGIRDYVAEEALLLIEWSERGVGFLPPADLEIWLDQDGEARRARWQGRGDPGAAIVARLQAAMDRA
jgi:tRNA threonylcarbamoyladenosine biosynthesis protein TsaE